MPKTHAELAQRVIDAENLFNNLPIEVRREFNFSVSEFFSSIGTEKFDSIFKDKTDNLVPPDPAPAVPVEVVQQPSVVPAVSQEGVSA